MQRLEQQTSLLTHPESILPKTHQINFELSNLMETRKRYTFESSLYPPETTHTSEFESALLLSNHEKKINLIYSMVEKLDPVVDTIPVLMNRLVALRKVHSEAAVFSDTLNECLNDQQNIKVEMERMDKDVCNLKESILENQKVMMKNVESLLK